MINLHEQQPNQMGQTVLNTPAAPKIQPEPAPQPLGRIVSVNGASARVLMTGMPHENGHAGSAQPYVGTVVSVNTGTSIVLCLITSMSVTDAQNNPDLNGKKVMDIEMVGELPIQDDKYLCTFRRGVSVYPRLGDAVHLPTRNILEKAYYFGSFDGVEIGHIHQDPTIPAIIKINEMLGKHFAILGSTGTGKSCTVAIILREFLAKQPQSHIVLVDPHNEYATCFGDLSNIITLENLRLPFWFLNFEEIVEILLDGKEDNSAEVELLREFIPAAKRQFAANRGRESRLLQRSVTRKERFSVDVPIPYRISDLVEQIKHQMGRLETQKDLRPYKHLISRIEAITQDPRYNFMFGKMMVEDNLGAILKEIFRIPVDGKPITIVQLVGLPTEIVNVIVSILARLAFDLALWSDGKLPITFVCEEAHRYVPHEKNVGFEPTKRIISRIAKEGRKYGISLCIVSQRPGDLDPTILSQCSTIFTMRLSNERDQRIVRSAVSDAAESLLRFLPSLGTRETIAFGEGITLPSRIMLAELPDIALPKAAGAHLDFNSPDFGPELVDKAILRWRSVGSDIESLLPPDAEGASVQQPQVAQAPNHQIAQAPNHQVAQAPNHQVAQAPNHQVAQAPNHQVAQAPNHQVAQAPPVQPAVTPRPMAQPQAPAVTQTAAPQPAAHRAKTPLMQ